MRKSKFLALLIGVLFAFSCIAALSLSASAANNPPKIYSVKSDWTFGVSHLTLGEKTLDTDSMYYFRRATPAADAAQVKLHNSGFNLALPSQDSVDLGGDTLWLKAILRTNTSGITPVFELRQYYATDGGSQEVSGGSYSASSPLSAGSWQTVYIKLDKTGFSFNQYFFRILGNANGNTFEEGAYVDIAGFGIFESEAAAIAYDLDEDCKKGEAAVYVSASGSDSNDGLTSSTPVQSLAKAQTVAKNTADVEKIYIMGTVGTPASASDLGVSGKPIQYLGYADASNPPVLNLNHRVNLVGDVTIDKLQLNSTKANDATYITHQFSLTLGPDLTCDTSISKATQSSITPVAWATQNASFTDPTVITIDAPFLIYRVAPSYDQSTWNGYARFNLGSTASIQNIYGGNGFNADENVNGIVEINAAAGSSVDQLIMCPEANGSAVTKLTSKGLRDFHLNGTLRNVYIAGSSKSEAPAESTGVAVWTFSNTSSVTNKFVQKGVANETAVTHVLIFNDNDALHTKYKTQSASWTVPNEYCFNVDNTGTVEAYMSKLPTSTSDLTCTLGGIKLTSTYTHAILDEGTANEQTVELATLTNGQYAIANIAAGDHTVTFTNVVTNDPVVFDDTATKSAAGYTAASVDAAEKAYAIIASFKLDTFDSSEITSFGAYFFNSENTRVDIYSSNPTLLDTSDGQYYVVIYGIGASDTSVAIKPYALIGENAYYGTVLDAVPATIGCDTYYGTESDVVNYFS